VARAPPAPPPNQAASEPEHDTTASIASETLGAALPATSPPPVVLPSLVS
jgi:hypothetical protein